MMEKIFKTVQRYVNYKLETNTERALGKASMPKFVHQIPWLVG